MGKSFRGMRLNSLFDNSFRMPINGKMEYPRSASIACLTASFEVNPIFIDIDIVLFNEFFYGLPRPGTFFSID